MNFASKEDRPKGPQYEGTGDDHTHSRDRNISSTGLQDVIYSAIVWRVKPHERLESTAIPIVGSSIVSTGTSRAIYCPHHSRALNCNACVRAPKIAWMA